jgi:hypothetical protein
MVRFDKHVPLERRALQITKGHPSPRIWKSADGKHTFEAYANGTKGDAILLVSKSGEAKTLEIKKLSSDDVAWIHAYKAAREPLRLN